MEHHHHTSNLPLPVTNPTLRDYLPLATVIAIIVWGAGAASWQAGFSLDHLLGFLMGFFFLIFGLFKLLDLPNFAMGYREYDLIAARFPAWGLGYPFIEVSLGGLYIAGVQAPWLDGATLLMSLLIVAGVAKKLAKHELIHCVCLGNILKVPLTYVSLVEYAVMAAMAGVMFVI